MRESNSPQVLEIGAATIEREREGRVCGLAFVHGLFGMNCKVEEQFQKLKSRSDPKNVFHPIKEKKKTIVEKLTTCVLSFLNWPSFHGCFLFIYFCCRY